MALTAEIAEWVAESALAPLPGAVRDVVGRAMLDTVACALYGRELEWTRIAEAWAHRSSTVADRLDGEEGLASVLGDRAPSLRPADAALVNGVAAHAYELDDYHPAKIHPGAVVVPAALAIGESGRASGDALLRAVAIGYEVMARTSLALGPSATKSKGWHLTGVAGPLGAAAAGAVLLGLDATRTAWALGLGGTQSSGLFAFNADGAMSKRFHAGNAARAGVVAAELAALGFTGPTQVYEAADGGLLHAFSPAPDPDTLVDGLGEHWHLLDTAFKPYACCGSLHAYVDAALDLRERLGPAHVANARVRIGLPKVVEVQCGFDYRPGTVLTAQMNARFCVASALRFGRVLTEEFADERLTDRDTLAIVERIEQRHDPELDEIYPARYSAWVEIEAPGDAGCFERAWRDEPSGAATNPDKPHAMLEKARGLLASRPDTFIRTLEAALVAPGGADARSVVACVAD